MFSVRGTEDGEHFLEGPVGWESIRSHEIAAVRSANRKTSFVYTGRDSDPAEAGRTWGTTSGLLACARTSVSAAGLQPMRC